MESKKPVVWMIAFGIVRHLLVIIGTWLQTRGLIDADTHQQIADPSTATQVLGWLLIVAPIAWSAAQKWQVWGWLKTKLVKVIGAEMSLAAIRADPTPQTIITASPGPNIPI